MTASAQVDPHPKKRKHHEFVRDIAQGKNQTLSLPKAERQAYLQKVRATLPIASHAQAIRNCLRGPLHDVLLLVGETGSGKSTQVPQYLLDEPWCKKCIAVTQPRRVAAISLARRVAEEMNTTLGSSSPASKVGYSVRFDNNTAPATRIKYLTEGMLLQEMIRDPFLSQYSAVIVDEVHERSVNVDLLLGFMRYLVTSGKRQRELAPLKVVVMSATANVDVIHDFFAAGYGEEEVQSLDGEKDSEASWSGVSDDHEHHNDDIVKNYNRKATSKSSLISSLNHDIISTCHIEGRQFPIQIQYLPDPTQDYTEAALHKIFQIHCKEPLPGDILVFLPGQDTIEALETMVNEFAAAMDPKMPKVVVLPLFAALPRTAQDLIFSNPPPFTRKIILATNIAETSVTIPGIRHVIDSGLAKVKEHRPTLALDSLLVKPISKSSATQRKGRAGREGPGKCYRLYTEREYLKLERETAPEILRCDLASAILTIKARYRNAEILNFPFLTPPSTHSLRKALLHLHRLGALSDDGLITEPIGRQMARLPLLPSLARVLVSASLAQYDVLDDAIDVVAAISSETIFLQLTSEEKVEAAADTRRELLRREGDHLTLLETVKAYANENTDRKRWAEVRFVSHRAMQNTMNIRKQLQSQCKSLGLSSELHKQGHASMTSVRLLKSLLVSNPSNVARLSRDGSYRTVEGNQPVSIHPSSVLFGKKVEAVVYDELVFTGNGKTCMRGVSAIEMGWWAEIIGNMSDT